MTRKLFFCLALLCIPYSDLWAACHVILPTGGSMMPQDGSDWNHACVAFSNGGSCDSGGPFDHNVLIRGDTYYLGGSDTVYPYSQGNPTIFSTPDSGTTPITIKKATATDHCTDTGYVSTYGTKNAKWIDTAPPSTTLRSSFIQFCDSDHWIIDGSVGDGTQANGGQNGQYGIYMEAQDRFGFGMISGQAGVCFNSMAATDITVRHVEINGVDGGGGGFYLLACCPPATGVYGVSTGLDNWKFDHMYIHDIGAQFSFAITNVVIDHVTMLRNYSSPANHSSAIDNSACGITQCGNANMIVRYSLLQDISGTGNISCLGPDPLVCDNWQIYGNVFYSDPVWVSTNGPNGEPHGTSKITGDNTSCPPGTVGTRATNWKLYNNAIVNQNQPGGQNVWFGICNVNSANNVAQNNLFYNIVSPSQVLIEATQSILAGDYNSYINVNLANGSSTNTHDQLTASGSPSPFVNGSGTPGDFHLATNNSLWNNGNPLSSPYNTDPDGVTRGTPDWSRGAYQFNGPGVPAVRTFLKKTPNSNRPAGTIFPIAMQLVDANLNPVSSIAVTLTVTRGSGMITPAMATTDSNGMITATVTLDSNPGLNTFVIATGTTTYVLNAAGF